MVGPDLGIVEYWRMTGELNQPPHTTDEYIEAGFIY